MTALALTNATEKSSVNRNTLAMNYLYMTNITRYIYPNPLHIYIYNINNMYLLNHTYNNSGYKWTP